MPQTLSERALLTTLHISQWTARKLDRAETSALNARHNLTVEGARVNKNLFPLATQLERVHQITGAIRKDFTARTLPWGLEGINILKASNYVEFCGVVNGWQNDWHSAVNEFIEVYPTLVEEAAILLGSLYKSEDYPDAADLRRRFHFSIEFMPVPDARDWRIDVGDRAREFLEQEITKRVRETEAAAMQVAWKRIYEVVEKCQERLRDPENIFRDSLVENAVALCAILPGLNITDDPQLEAARQQLEGVMAPYVGNVDVLRSDTEARSVAATQLNEIMERMAGVYSA